MQLSTVLLVASAAIPNVAAFAPSHSSFHAHEALNYAAIPVRRSAPMSSIQEGSLLKRATCEDGLKLCDDRFCTDGICCFLGNGASCPPNYRCTPNGCCELGKSCGKPATCTPHASKECPGRADCCNSALPYCAREKATGKAVCTDMPEEFEEYEEGVRDGKGRKEKEEKEGKKDTEEEKEEKEEKEKPKPKPTPSSTSDSDADDGVIGAIKSDGLALATGGPDLDAIENDNEVEVKGNTNTNADEKKDDKPESAAGSLRIPGLAAGVLGGAALFVLFL